MSDVEEIDTFVEEEVLFLPFLTDGHMNLGDLWDCTRSMKAPDTLFTKSLTLEYIEEPLEINKDEKNIEYCKSTSDILKLIDVHGEMKLELPLNILNIKGSALYKSEQKDHELFEKLLYNYVYKTYQIRVNKDSKKLIDQNVIDKINGKILKATHFVYAITLGAEINAEITVSQSENVDKKEVDGNALLDLSLKKIKLSGEAFLNWIDNENKEKLSNRVKIQSAPALETKAETIEVLREEVKNIKERIKETKFLKGREDIKGVAIRYELWPIKIFIDKFDLNIEYVYRKLKSHELKEFEETLLRMCDIRNPNYVTGELIKRYPHIITILYDQNSQLTKAVIKYEDEIREIASRFLLQASKAMQNYKQNLTNIEELLKIVRTYDSECKQSDVIKKFNDFVDLGKEELSFVPKLENLDLRKYINIITSEESLRDFKNDKQDVKIWLYNNDKILETVHQCLYDIIKILSENGVKIGIAVKSISKFPEFCIDIKGKTIFYKKPEHYQYIFGIISSSLGFGNENKNLFHSIHAKMLNMELPLKTLHGINDFIERMMPFNKVIIGETSLSTFNLLRVKDNKWKFFIPINAEQSSFEAIRKMAQIFNSDTPTSCYLRDPENIDWIVGSLDVKQKINETAFLIIVKNSKVMATCLDELDISLMSDMFLEKNEKVLTLFESKAIGHSLYTQRAKSAEIIIKNIELENHENLNIKVYGLESFEKDGDEDMDKSTGKKIQKLLEGWKKLSGSGDRTRGVVDFLNFLTNKEIFNERNWEEIWKNNRFEYLINSVIDDYRILDELFKMGNKTFIPHYIPAPIAQKFKDRFFSVEDFQKINNFDEFKMTLETIAIRREVPKNFRKGLLDSLKDNIELLNKLDQLEILKLMHYDGRVFPDEIGIETIDKIRKIIFDSEFKKPDPQDLKHLDISFKKEFPKRSESIKTDMTKINSKFALLLGRSIKILRYEEYIQLKQILKKPKLSGIDPQNFKEIVLPYLVQRIKMWGCHSLTPYKVCELIESKILKNEIIDPFSDVNIEFNEPNEQENEVEVPFSRLDIIVAILNSVDALVAQEVLNNMSKFFIALPLVMRDLTEEKSYKVLIPWLTQPIIKWEIDKENIIENHMFVDKFKLITCLRVGDASLGKNGKSSLLNAILTKKNIFTCCGEPRAFKGKPLTLDGTVEFIFLTKETVGEELWSSFLKDYYLEEEELLLLANLHGDALEHRDILLLLDSITTSYIVFMMPNVGESKYDDFHNLKNKELKNILKTRNISYLLIDPPTGSKHKHKDIILDSSKTDDSSNLEKLINILKTSAKLFSCKAIHLNELELNGCVRMAEKIETVQSNNFIKFAETKSWSITKNSLFLQKQVGNNDKRFNTPENEKIQNETISLMRHILLLDKETRLIAMTHLDKELSRISSYKARIARRNYIKYHEEYKINKSDGTLEKRNRYRNQMDENNFGLEHIFREIGRVYQLFTSKFTDNEQNPYWDAPKLYAELLIDGHALELLDGDSCSITGSWLSAIFEHVNVLKPGLRVFVISIIGLQSSGKSTLLNALFACKFAVSVGRCTKGIFMRLLFMDEKIKSDLDNKFDAILLIDSEGLEALEKINEKDAGRKDRAMATLGMGISHLTIVNVKGENMNSLTDILQIALIAMTRLKIADISPDILIVQHMDDTDDASLATARISFSEALEQATKLLKNRPLDLGVINSDCLEKLKETIESNKYFKSFPPFKNGPHLNSPASEGYQLETVQLFNNILDMAKNSTRKTDFVQWPVLVENFWESVKNEDFLNFQDLEKISEFLKVNSLISEVKKSIVSAYGKHRDRLLEKYHKENLSDSKIPVDKIGTDFDYELKTCLTNKEPCSQCKKYKSDRSILYKEVKNNLKTITDIDSYANKTRKSMVHSIEMLLEAEKTREYESEDVLKTINKFLEKQLKNKKAGTYEENEIETLTQEICTIIRNEKAQKNPEENIEIQIINEIKSLYPKNPKFVEKYERKPIESLKKYEENFLIIYVKKFFVKTRTLAKYQIEQLQTKIYDIISGIFKGEKARKFEPWMIETVKKGTEGIIKDFEKTVGEMTEKFKLKLHSFSYHIFQKEMKLKQDEWDKQFNPYRIFCEMEPKYRELIRDRLKLGFGFDEEGTITGCCLVTAIKCYAMEEAYKYKIESIKKIGWLTSSETIRLKYFLELVEQVERKDFKKALQHFDNPKMAIEEWFKEVLDELPVRGVMVKFKAKIKSECEIMIEKIECSSTLDEIRNHVKDYAQKTKAIIYVVDKKETDQMNLQHFIRRMVKVINDFKETDFKESEFQLYFSSIEPSNDKTLWETLGCTASCPICSALCWGERDHDKDTGDSRIHHTSHQPMGLSRTDYKASKKLCAQSCHHQENTESWWINDEEVSWSELIARPEFNNWLYGVYREKAFDDMMKWFFNQLHNDIAKNKSLEPADVSELKENKFNSLNIIEIKAKINQKIGIINEKSTKNSE